MTGQSTAIKGRRCEFVYRGWVAGRSVAMLAIAADEACAENNIDIGADTPDAVFDRFVEILCCKARRLGVRVIKTFVEKAEKKP